MADSLDNVREQVRQVGRNLSDTYTFKNARESAGRMYDSAKKTARDTVNRYSDRAKKAMSSGRSRSR